MPDDEGGKDDKNIQSSAEDISSSDDDDFGPSLAPEPQDSQRNSHNDSSRRKRRKLNFESAYLSALPNSKFYTKSYQHQDEITSLKAQPNGGRLIVSGSKDGIVKFWAKSDTLGEIEFIKQYQCHIDQPVSDLAFSHDGKLLATISPDGTSKIFDCVSFDMIGILDFDFHPGNTCCWALGTQLLVVPSKLSSEIYLFDPLGSDLKDGESKLHPIHVLSSLHKSHVTSLVYNPLYECMVSCDDLGMIEYWRPVKPFDKPKSVFEMKSSTNLYDFRKRKVYVQNMSLSKAHDKLSMATSDGKITILDFRTGKRLREYDESLSAIIEMQQSGTSAAVLDDAEFSKRLALDKANNGPGEINTIFDASGNFIIYSTLLGIKIVNIKTNSCVLLLGKDESPRFCKLALYQGMPKRKGVMTVDMASSENDLISKSKVQDPVLLSTGLLEKRFFIFTRKDKQNVDLQDMDRDVISTTTSGTKTGSEDDSNSAANDNGRRKLAQKVTLHTTLGDISVKLYPEYAPKAVENFTTLCKKGYYDNLIFHRVIKHFMIQGGDPLGDGTGGESIWKDHFEDEFSPYLRHNEPYMLSMANAGPNTNGSQFFITTEKTPWLDDKHTIFGKVVGGQDVVKAIEQLKTGKNDRPLEPPSIVSTSVY